MLIVANPSPETLSVVECGTRLLTRNGLRRFSPEELGAYEVITLYSNAS